MSRTMPTDCETCGGVIDWGDFGPDPDDGQVGRTCHCEPTLLVWLREQIRDSLADVTVAERHNDHLGVARAIGRIQAYERVAEHHGWGFRTR